MNLNVTHEIDTSVRRSAAAMTVFQNRLVLFGGVPHEDDLNASPPASISQSDFFNDISRPNEQRVINNNDFIFSSSTSRTTTSKPNFEINNINDRDLFNKMDHFRRLRKQTLENNSNYNKRNNRQREELRRMSQESKQLIIRDESSFPSIESRSPLFILTATRHRDHHHFQKQQDNNNFINTNYKWQYLQCSLHPWSRHGHFMLVDPFNPQSLRILGGRHWHIGDEVPEKDLVFEICSHDEEEKSQVSSMMKFYDASIPKGFPSSLFSAAIAKPKIVSSSSKKVTLAYTFGGMVANRTLTNAVYRVHCEKCDDDVSSSSSKWSATKLETIGSEPSPQFKGIACLTSENNINNSNQSSSSSLLTFDGFVGRTNVPPNVHELDLETLVWRHVCMSTPIARGVGMEFGTRIINTSIFSQDKSSGSSTSRYLYIHGGHRTTDPIHRVGSFVVFDLKLKKWIGLKANNNRREVVVAAAQSRNDNFNSSRSTVDFISASQNARSAHCAIVLSNEGETEGAYRYYFGADGDSYYYAEKSIIFGGSEERKKAPSENDSTIVISVINDGEDPINLNERLIFGAGDRASEVVRATSGNNHSNNERHRSGGENSSRSRHQVVDGNNHVNNNDDVDDELVQHIRIPAPLQMRKAYEENLKRTGDTGNGGEPYGSLMICEMGGLMMMTGTTTTTSRNNNNKRSLLEECIEFLGEEQDELLDDLF